MRDGVLDRRTGAAKTSDGATKILRRCEAGHTQTPQAWLSQCQLGHGRHRCHHRRGKADRAAAVIGGQSLRPCWYRFLSWPPCQSQPSTTSIGHRRLLLPSLPAPSNHRCPITHADFPVRSNASRAECHAREELDGKPAQIEHRSEPAGQTLRPSASRLFYGRKPYPRQSRRVAATTSGRSRISKSRPIVSSASAGLRSMC